MLVCRFCRSTLLKDAATVRNLGVMSEVLEDYSPLQIGAAGRFGTRAFSLIGRIQLKYPDGFWNEWYAAFDDGGNGWLSDASGQFALTSAAAPGDWPLFEKLRPGSTLAFGGRIYTAADVREAQCTAGQGELPFSVGPGWRARVADFRADDRFLSLDYSDGAAAQAYAGQAVDVSSLELQPLRDPNQIRDSAGRYHGKISVLNCPSCGAPVRCVPGITVQILCPNCHADVDSSGSAAVVLAAEASLQQVPFTLALGVEAPIDGARYTVLGAMRRVETDDTSAWTEYLLYAPGRPFIWLVETAEGWQRAQVQDRWPAWDGGGEAVLGGRRYNRRSIYDARVVFAAGSFNWRVKLGDVTHVIEFADHDLRLAAEATATELTWSRASPLALDQVRAWFGAHVHDGQHPQPPYRHTAGRILIALLLVNAIPLVIATANCLPYVLIAAIAIYLPAYYFDRLDGSP